MTEIEAKALALVEAQIKHMAERFLSWKLPENFNPDAGIRFEPFFNVEYNAKHGKPPQRNEPTGTNLFDYTQALGMVRHMVEGLPSADLIETQAREIERLRSVVEKYATDLCEMGGSHELCGLLSEVECGGCFARAALAGDSHDHTIKRGTECPYSHDGFHHVDTSMESGPNNCFHCERPMT